VALIAYLPEELRDDLGAVQARVRDATGLACTLGFGPRLLRSGPRAGGGETGLYLLLTCNGGEELPGGGFQALYRAQAQADLDRLSSRGRRALRVHADPGEPMKAIRVMHEAIRLI
jgi:transaldolase/glucose-6-phosphate isomerase